MITIFCKKNCAPSIPVTSLFFGIMVILLISTPGRAGELSTDFAAPQQGYSLEESYFDALAEFEPEKTEATFSVSPLKLGWLQYQNSIMQDVYGKKGALLYEIEGAYHLTNWLSFSLSSGLLKDNGHALYKINDTTTAASGDHTRIWLFPFTLNAYARYQPKLDQLFVPYAGLGGDFIIWNEKRMDAWKKTGYNSGLHAKLGCNVLLDFLEPAPAGRLDRDWGITDTFLVLEAKWMLLDDFGSTKNNLDLSALVLSSGVQFDF